jgi:hypothetical protein
MKNLLEPSQDLIGAFFELSLRNVWNLPSVLQDMNPAHLKGVELVLSQFFIQECVLYFCTNRKRRQSEPRKCDILKKEQFILYERGILKYPFQNYHFGIYCIHLCSRNQRHMLLRDRGPSLLGDEVKGIEIVYGEEKYFVLGRLEQPRQEKNLLYRHEEPKEPTIPFICTL